MATGILVFVLGLVLGSFINAFLWRFRTGRAIFWARSQCVYCDRQLGVGDLLPLISFFWLKGRCRYCRRRISWQYPLVELFSALGVWLIHIQSFDLYKQVWLSGLFLVWLAIFFYDAR